MSDRRPRRGNVSGGAGGGRGGGSRGGRGGYATGGGGGSQQQGHGGRGRDGDRGGGRGSQQGHGGRGRDGDRGGGRGSQQQYQQRSGPGFNTGSRRGRDGSLLTWSERPMPMEVDPVAVQMSWHHPGPLPESAAEVKDLMPRNHKSGTRSLRPKIVVETNFFLTDITVPTELHRYEIAVTKIKDPTIKQLSVSGLSLNPKRPLGREDHSGGNREDGERPQGTVHKDILKKVVETFMGVLQNQCKEIGMFHDFSKTIFTNKRLPATAQGPYSISHGNLRDEDDTNCSYELKLTKVALNIDLDRVRELINERFLDHPDPNLIEYKHVTNIMLKNLGGGQWMQNGRSSLMKTATPSNWNYLECGLMNWKGISAVFTLGTTWKPFINIDIQNSAFLIGQNVINTIAEILDQRKSVDVTRWSSKDFRDVTAILKSCKVRRVVKGRKYDKSIQGIDAQPATEIRFKIENRTLTVAQYYKEQGITLQYPKGPVLLMGAKCHVPAEICTIKSGQSYNRFLPLKSAPKMLTMATDLPSEKHINIMNAVDDLKLKEHHLLKTFGVSVTGKMLEMKETRVLPPPDLCYGKAIGGGDSKKRGVITPSNGVWDLWSHSIGFFSPMNANSWAILSVGLNYEVDHRPFVESLLKEAAARGMTFPEPATPDWIELQEHGRHSDNVKLLTETLTGMKRKLEGDKCFILCIIPSKSVFYSQVKQAAERNESAEVLTQCIVEKNFNKANHSVIKNLLLKINAKLGGINHVPIIPEPDLKHINIMSIPTLVLGIDVNHPSVPIQGKCIGQPSFAAVTGSIDRSAMPYMMHVQAQMQTDTARISGAAEVVQNLDTIVKNMLNTFKNKTGHQPRRIIVYRDGVGESQFPEILQIEFQAIRRACAQLNSSYTPSITFIAVQKKHKVRFFIKQNGQISKDNVPAGTVVDSEIVQGSDFYLVSHQGVLGTSRPTHYHVLWDDSDFSADEIQSLTYFLCFMYSRCNRSVSYPAPTYYSHWAAFRANNLAAGYENWNGDEESLRNLNEAIQRSIYIKTGFPMHFI